MASKIIGRLWLTILSINVVNIAMILSNFKYRIDPFIFDFNNNVGLVFAKQKLQAQVHDMEAEFNNDLPKSQLDRIRKNSIIRVAIIGDKAYWVHDNTFYETEIIDGYIDNDNAKPIDAFKLSDKEFVKLLTILDNISK